MHGDFYKYLCIVQNTNRWRIVKSSSEESGEGVMSLRVTAIKVKGLVEVQDGRDGEKKDIPDSFAGLEFKGESCTACPHPILDNAKSIIKT